jgi:hypothetical protein
MSRRAPDIELLKARAEAMVREAFHGVTREGGISWSETEFIDRWGERHKRAAARAKDVEACWEELVEDPAWDHEVTIGGFNFLDAIGFRYYIAPALVRCVRSGGGEFTSYALKIETEHQRGIVSLLDERQQRAVARCVRLMIDMHEAESDETYGAAWKAASRTYWGRFE